MKTNTSLFRSLAAAVVLAFGTATHTSFAQTTSTTTPVGFVTIAIAGGGTPSAPAYTFTTLGLVNPIAFQSTTTTSTAGTATITDTAATWANNTYNSTTADAPPTHFVEILSGPAAGSMYDIVTTNGTGQSLTVSPALAAGVTAGVSYAIRPHWTIASVFGPTVNTAGGLTGATTSGNADQIQLWRNGGFATYYYSTGGLAGTGWRQFGVAGDATNTVIYPDDGMIIAFTHATGVNLVINGAVKTGQTSVPVLTGYSLLGNVYAAGMTLTSSGLYTDATGDTGVKPGNGSSTGDQILVWNPATAGYRTFFYGSGGLFGTGWKEFGVSGDASGTALPVGSALFINRAGTPFNWVAPQHPATFN